MRAVDTNVVVRLIVEDDPAQARAAETFIQTGAWVSHLVLIEAVWVLSAVYGLNPRQIATAIEMLVTHRSLSVQDADTVTAALEQFRKKPSLGFSDCLVLEVARRAGHLPLGSFDRDLGTLNGARRL